MNARADVDLRPVGGRLHVYRAAQGAGFQPILRWRCDACGYVSGWEPDTLPPVEQILGLPCPACSPAGASDG